MGKHPGGALRLGTQPLQAHSEGLEGAAGERGSKQGLLSQDVLPPCVVETRSVDFLIRRSGCIDSLRFA